MVLKAKMGDLVDFGSQNPIFAFKVIKIDLFLSKIRNNYDQNCENEVEIDDF